MDLFWGLGIVLALVVFAIGWRFWKKKKRNDLINDIASCWGTFGGENAANMDLVKRYFYGGEVDAFHRISDQTAMDLDLDSVFARIDRTRSGVGKQVLYARLRNVRSKEEVQAFDQMVDRLTGDDKRFEMQADLAALSGDKAYYIQELFQGLTIERPRWFPLVYVSLFSVVGILLFMFQTPALALGLIPLFFINAGLYYWNKKNVNFYRGGIIEFSRALSVVGQLKSSAFKENDFSFLSPLRALKRKTAFVNVDYHFADDITAVFFTLLELGKITFNIEVITMYSVIDKLMQHRKEVEQMFLFIGETDAALSVAQLRSEGGVVKPLFTDGSVEFSKAIHPLVPACVPNDLSLDGKGVLLTGSNMAGKSTFIRTIGINALLGQTIATCFAGRAKYPFWKISSVINIEDELSTGKSYYMKEVLAVKELIEKANDEEPCLAILDELFKGTNTEERIAGGKAILNHLQQGNNTVLISTHDLELVSELKDSFDLYHFNEKVIDNQLMFDHQLKKGPVTTRNAIKILEINGYPDDVIKAATAQKAGFTL